MPSAFGVVSWNMKSVVKVCTFTGMLNQPLPASLAPPSVKRKRVPLRTALPFSARPLEEKPEPKLIPEDTPVAVNVVDPEMTPEVAEIVVLCPAVPAVASPAEVIVAPAVFEEAHVAVEVRSWVLLLEYVPVAWN